MPQNCHGKIQKKQKKNIQLNKIRKSIQKLLNVVMKKKK